jgi:mannosyltransferase OCH1-like enzyme
MPIPKVIYQTWKSKSLPKEIEEVRASIAEIHPGYEMILYDDVDIDEFIRKNYDAEFYEAYSKLNIGAAKADFWRYCVLYTCGGVYLDIDADILFPLDWLINDGDTCILTREKNPPFFNNWIMLAEKGHPLMLEALRQCVYNINNKTSTNIGMLTGPGPLTAAVLKIMKPLYSRDVHLYNEKDEDLNKEFNTSGPVRLKVYEYDMGKFCRFKSEGCESLYKEQVHWISDSAPLFKD